MDVIKKIQNKDKFADIVLIGDFNEDPDEQNISPFDENWH